MKKIKKGQIVKCLYDLEQGITGESFYVPKETIGIVTEINLGYSKNLYEVFWQNFGKKVFVFEDQIEIIKEKLP